MLFEPSARVSLASVDRTRDRVLLQTLDNVRSRLTALSLEGRRLDARRDPDARARHRGAAATSDLIGVVLLHVRGLHDADVAVARRERRARPSKVKTMPAFFDAKGITTEQFEATSKDGTKIPYFVVRPKGVKADGTAPTLLYGYGGFEVSEVPQLQRRPRVRRGSRAAACTSSRTSAAAASSAPAGTRPR